MVAHGLLVGQAVRNFDRNGEAMRCYVVVRDEVKILNRARFDPQSGRECRPLTPDVAEKIALYNKGLRPQRMTSDEGPFFSPFSGEPVAWYGKSASGAIEIFNLMGFHPQTGEELLPVDRAVVDAWKEQNSRRITRTPVAVDPDHYPFFDATTGAPNVSFWRDQEGDYAFFDGPGFHPTTDEALRPITRIVIGEWR